MTGVVQAQDNVLVVRVYRWSDGTYVENQDMWRLSGIFRDVELWSPGVVHVADVQVVTELDAGYGQAVVRVAAEMANMGASERHGVQAVARLFDRGGSRSRSANECRRGPPAGGGNGANVGAAAARAATVVGGSAVPLHAGSRAAREQVGRRRAADAGSRTKVSDAPKVSTAAVPCACGSACARWRSGTRSCASTDGRSRWWASTVTSTTRSAATRWTRR